MCGLLGLRSGAEPPGFTIDDLHAVSRGKSFDYRLLHHVLRAICSLRCIGDTLSPQDEGALLDFLAIDEWLVDIGDDLVDYEDDVMR